MAGKLYLIGIGPGSLDNITIRAMNKLKESDIIIGYSKYIELIREIIGYKEIFGSSVVDEIARAEMAIKYTIQGKKVSVISSGDSGIYGMAGIVLEMVSHHNYDIDIEIVPGITSLSSSSSLIGTPLMNDFCSISLSDRLTPWEMIEKRIKSAAESDFAIVFYNPKSQQRTEGIKKAREIIMEYRNKNTPVGIIKNAYRENQESFVTNLEKFLGFDIDMFTTIIVGNSRSYQYKNYMITPRNYDLRYNL